MNYPGTSSTCKSVERFLIVSPHLLCTGSLVMTPSSGFSSLLCLCSQHNRFICLSTFVDRSPRANLSSAFIVLVLVFLCHLTSVVLVFLNFLFFTPNPTEFHDFQYLIHSTAASGKLVILNG